VLTIDTSGSPSGDVGIVAMVPIGMCRVSGVNMTHELGKECRKGDEFGYFTFGGSDIIVLFQEGANPSATWASWSRRLDLLALRHRDRDGHNAVGIMHRPPVQRAETSATDPRDL
jgi:hypothetical protein